jgi:signal transduction histidine kinase
MSIRLSIRYKILAVVGVLLVAAVSFYTLLASSIFRQEKTALLYDINHSIAVNIAAQIRSSILQTSDQVKMQLFSELYATGKGKLSQKSLKEARILGVELFKKQEEKYQPLPVTRNYPINDYQPEKMLAHVKETRTHGYALWSEPSEPPRFFLATDIEVSNSGEVQHYLAVAELDRTLFFAPLQSANLFQSYLSKGNGEIVLGFNKSNLTPSSPLPQHPLLQAAVRREGTTSGVLAFNEKGENWYGAYAPLGIANLFFLSQASRSEVTSATEVLIHRSILFGLIVLTATFMASILFSRGLTRNLRLLTLITKSIEKGNLSTRIRIRSGDEVEELSTSFNAMVEALKASRDAIERYNRELEDKVALRTQQLHETNAEIKEVQEQLLKSTQLAAVGEVAGKTAHEVLNPLTALASRIERTRSDVEKKNSALPRQFSEILNAWEKEVREGGVAKLLQSLQAPSAIEPAQSLLEEDLGNLRTFCTHWMTEQQEIGANLRFVQKEAERIHRIVDRMRQLVRSSEVKDDVHCHDLLRSAMTTMADFMEKHGVTLKENFLAEQDSAHLNRDEFIQIVTNLVRNAYQAIEANPNEIKESGLIQLKTSNEEKFLKIEVHDNGMGIPKDKQKLIFEQGFTTKAPTDGTGLGLAICRRYARAFGGDVELAFSSPQEGTSFVIIVPLQEAKELKIAS